MPLIQIAPPSVEPVTVDEVMDSFRGDDVTAFTSQATLIIKALRTRAEALTSRRFITQTVELVLSAFPRADIDLVLPNVQNIISVKYFDINGNEQTLASSKYTLDADSFTNWLMPPRGSEWPETIEMANAVRVRFVVGYGDAGSDVPEDIRLWIVAHAVQILNSPDGLIDDRLVALPFVDRLLDFHMVYRAF